jgi:hypothetical protein
MTTSLHLCAKGAADKRIREIATLLLPHGAGKENPAAGRAAPGRLFPALHEAAMKQR